MSRISLGAAFAGACLAAAVMSGDAYAQSVSCSAFGKIKSKSYNERATIDVVNDTDRQFNVFWLDYDGTIDAAGRYELTTHSGDIGLHIPREANAQLTVSTWSGSIDSQFPIVLKPGEQAVWDWRFHIGYHAGEDDSDGQANGVSGAVLVRPLGLSAYATLRRDIATKLRPPARAAASLPAVWSGERLIAVPGLAGAPFQDGRFTARFLGLRRGPA